MKGRGRLTTARSWWNARYFCALAGVVVGTLIWSGSALGRVRAVAFPPTLGALIRTLRPPQQASSALPVTVELLEPGYTFSAFAHDCMGGMEFLPDGDLVCLDQAARLYRFDANGDGTPPGEQTLAQPFSGSNIFGAFVKRAPDNSFLLVAESSFGQLVRIDTGTWAVTPVATIQQPFDAAFLDATHVLLSANPTGASASLIRLNLSTGATQLIATFSGPSGPLALDANCNLFYIRGTFEFPAPPHSHVLLKFPALLVTEALQGLRVLSEGDAVTVATLDAGYALAINQWNDRFITNLFGGIIHRLNRKNFPQDFAQASGGFALFSYLALLHPESPFLAYSGSPTRLAFFMDDFMQRQVIVVRPQPPKPTRSGCRVEPCGRPR